jgi:acyl dehydratase
MSSFTDLIGKELGPTEWFEVDQERIDLFARATDDPQWIHTDPERAAAGPFGTTVAHGYLTLALLPALLGQVLDAGAELMVNYGLNRMRLPSPVPVDSRLRARFEVASVEPVAGGVQLTLNATIEREGGDKPVCVAETVYRLLG